MYSKRLRKELKAGTKVKIISREYVDSLPMKGEELIFGFVGSMKRYCGKITRIKKAYRNRYSLEIDDGQYNWSDEMFEMVVNGLLRNE